MNATNSAEVTQSTYACEEVVKSGYSQVISQGQPAIMRRLACYSVVDPLNGDNHFHVGLNLILTTSHPTRAFSLLELKSGLGADDCFKVGEGDFKILTGIVSKIAAENVSLMIQESAEMSRLMDTEKQA